MLRSVSLFPICRMVVKDLDKFVDDIESVLPNFKYLESAKEGFLFKSSACETMKDAGTDQCQQIEHRDIGTEMTPLGSSTTSRCHTPFKWPSPARHNTPENWSGPLEEVEEVRTESGKEHTASQFLFSHDFKTVQKSSSLIATLLFAIGSSQFFSLLWDHSKIIFKLKEKRSTLTQQLPRPPRRVG